MSVLASTPWRVIDFQASNLVEKNLYISSTCQIYHPSPTGKRTPDVRLAKVMDAEAVFEQKALHFCN